MLPAAVVRDAIAFRLLTALEDLPLGNLAEEVGISVALGDARATCRLRPAGEVRPAGPPADPNLVQLAVSYKVVQILDGLPAGCPPAPLAVELTRNGVANLELMRHRDESLPIAGGKGSEALTEVRRDMLRTVHGLCERLGHRVIGEQVHEALVKAGQAWSLGYVKSNLSWLVEHKYLTNARRCGWRAHGGY